jgi:uncharacterized protein (UPF0548 family)
MPKPDSVPRDAPLGSDCYHLVMFCGKKPDDAAILRFLAAEQGRPFSYPEVGASRLVSPSGYNIDHNRIMLGEGHATFAKAVEALKRWKMFKMDWVEIVPKEVPITEGSCVAIIVRHFGFWSLNASRIVYVIDEQGPLERFGFAYGTLPGHVERGEERFSLEYHSEDNSVWYDLFAFSRPGHLLARLGYPISRRLQRRFATDSLKAMKKAVDE